MRAASAPHMETIEARSDFRSPPTRR